MERSDVSEERSALDRLEEATRRAEETADAMDAALEEARREIEGDDG